MPRSSRRQPLARRQSRAQTAKTARVETERSDQELQVDEESLRRLSVYDLRYRCVQNGLPDAGTRSVLMTCL